MKTWYSDENLFILFDKTPCVGIRYPLPSMTKAEKKAIAKYPFINKQELKVKIVYYQGVWRNESEFIIPRDYCFDGASIPKIFYRIIGAPTDNHFLIAALVHDWMCEHHDVVDDNRYLSTCIFNALLKVGGVNPFKRWLMKHSVDNWQKFCGWEK